MTENICLFSNLFLKYKADSYTQSELLPTAPMGPNLKLCQPFFSHLFIHDYEFDELTNRRGVNNVRK